MQALINICILSKIFLSLSCVLPPNSLTTLLFNMYFYMTRWRDYMPWVATKTITQQFKLCARSRSLMGNFLLPFIIFVGGINDQCDIVDYRLSEQQLRLIRAALASSTVQHCAILCQCEPPLNIVQPSLCCVQTSLHLSGGLPAATHTWCSSWLWVALSIKSLHLKSIVYKYALRSTTSNRLNKDPHDTHFIVNFLFILSFGESTTTTSSSPRSSLVRDI